MRRDPGTLDVGHKMVKQAHGTWHMAHSTWYMAHGTVQQYFAMLPRHQYDGMTKQTVVGDKTIAFQFDDS